ncbi:aureocin A53 family class IId bacteriocin [Weissella diestrammenae]|uniref:Aureocin A53 family class IId bacteriocin n=1 Tax=Weissella diestrammenae TaxID=1162633 RepID=A0A7G9T4A2_9LACO|nr:aureocin A53 family class IId bacteriocin [Weissella diestrammenae]MCM0583458.1 aureocin A53 family class IId bacteriocin [Weissella diestrammenae]QNN74927.1 aureocin A53 family class IId bacteriocin [Weissella diestrammenae]
MAVILDALAAAGSTVLNWGKNNIGTIIKWLNAGQAIDWIINKIKQILHIK